jgi:pro-apoptotic serine protease NMA111
MTLSFPAWFHPLQTHCRAFDTEVASSSYATGFVVDRSLGLILTNRHVVTPCPIVAEAIFQNREEVPVFPLYYDPIHDFGFFRFDPAHLKFMQPQDIVLAPEAAQVGLEIRVVGNDSGEKISILSGTLARLDRDAPHYGSDSYNDFNTFYIQAASGTKGGSSGSPVIDILGRAVGLNAGGRHKAASAYYLPLHRIVRALHLLRGCAALPSDGATWKSPHSVISRGDLQATFTFKGFDELRRLGLRAETEAGVRRTQQQRHLGLRHKSGSEGAEAAAVARTRATSENDDVAVADVDATSLAVLEGQSVGMLVIDSVVPKGPSDGILQSGDVLVRVNGHVVTDFLSLESILDDHVDTHVSVEVERGGASVTAQVLVQDLTVVTPKRFVEFGGGVVHGLSYQQARNHLSSVGQVYVADAGYLLSKVSVF